MRSSGIASLKMVVLRFMMIRGAPTHARTVKPAPYTPSLMLSPTSPILSTPMLLAPPANSSTSSPAHSGMLFYVRVTKNSWSTRMNGHQSSSKNPDNLTLTVPIHNKSHQLPFNSCWNVRVLHNLLPNTNHITCCHLDLIYQFFLSSRYSPG